MSTAPGVPLRPDYTARDRALRQSLVRTITGVAFAKSGTTVTQYVSKNWPKDDLAAKAALALDRTEVMINSDREIVSKATVRPATSATLGLPEITAVNVLSVIAPESAAAGLFARCRRASLDGISTILFPYIAPGVAPVYIAPGGPMPIVRRTSSGATLGPSRKILVGAAVSEELENSGPEAASEVIGRSIEDDISRSLDALTFDDLPDDGVRPAGLLNGLTALTPTAGSGLDAISGDVANIAGQIADNGVRSSNMVIVCNPRQRAKLVTLVGSKFDYEVLDSPQIPDGRVIGIAPSCVVSAYSGVPKLERASNALVHLEDTTPTDIGIVGSPATVAAPVLSAAQCGLIVIRLRCESAFARVAPGIAFVDSVSW